MLAKIFSIQISIQYQTIHRLLHELRDKYGIFIQASDLLQWLLSLLQFHARQYHKCRLYYIFPWDLRIWWRHQLGARIRWYFQNVEYCSRMEEHLLLRRLFLLSFCGKIISSFFRVRSILHFISKLQFFSYFYFHIFAYFFTNESKD